MQYWPRAYDTAGCKCGEYPAGLSTHVSLDNDRDSLIGFNIMPWMLCLHWSA